MFETLTFLLEQQEADRKLLLKVEEEFLIEKYNLFTPWPFTVFIRVRDMTRASFISGERAYDAKYFHDRVCRYMIDDHNVPSLR